MKKVILLVFATIGLLGFYSCDDENVTVTLKTKNEAISMEPGYAKDIYYSLKNGVVSSVSRTDWDIAFSVDARSSSIIINEGANVVLKVYPTTTGWNWNDAIDTTGIKTWTALNNADSSWEEGAFGQNATGHPNYGWGVYNSTSHNVEGAALYIIKLVDGTYRRIFIEVKNAFTQQYSFKYSDINGGNEQVKTISYSGATSNFIYYSLSSNAVVVDREPDTSTWDLLFTKYNDGAIHYNVTGVIQNMGVQAIDKSNVHDIAAATYSSSEFVDNITEIGADWKSFNQNTYVYDIDAERVYFVKDQNDKVYKLVFTGFDYTTGNITFDITSL